MAHSNFVHLHLHTEYSFLDGAIRIKDLVQQAAKYKMPALAITDHGGMFGSVDFFDKCMAEGIKPIIGCEVYVAPGARTDRSSGRGMPNNHHLVLLARDQEGYRNLMKLSSIGYREGFYYKPRVDKEVLHQYAAGLIGMSACLKGEIPQLLLQERYDDARTLALEYQSLFGPDHFYLEIQNHGIDEELIAFERVIAMSRDTGIPLVLTNDAHYLRHADAEAHEALLCIQTAKTLNDPDRMRFSSDQIYFKSPDEMAELFAEAPDAYKNTLKIAEMCNVKVGTKELMLPSFDLPKGYKTEKELLYGLARDGLEHRYNKVTPGLRERLDYELDVICSMGYAGYFLIVADFTKEARRKGVYVGCRGSAAASLAAYCLRITDIDPIRFNLIFERFLNPERVSMPDADIDFADRDRHKVIDYVVKKYGRENVCQIITYGTMQAKAVVRDVARVMGLQYADGDRIAKLIPTGKSLQQAIEMVKELKDLIQSRGDYQKLWEYALVLEGLVRQPGMHAAGLIIAKDNIVNFAPLYKPSDSEDILCQYDMNHVEQVGLVKMDFLGLKTLTVLQDAVHLIHRNHGVQLDLWKIPYDDAKAYELFGRGETSGIFQFESNGMRDYLRKLKPERIDDLIAMNALYRPGPMDSIDTYIHRKHGREKVEYLHPSMEEVLKESYGVITYQEHVMHLAQHLAGFSLGRADNLRRAMGKKKAGAMEKARDEFIQGAGERKIDSKIALKIFEPMEKFAGYGFNKAHAAVYAHLAYQSGYLKTHYTPEYMASLLSNYMGNTDDVVQYVQECRRLGIEVLPPDVNESNTNFTVVEGKIRFGLGAIKNAGTAALDTIIRTREEKGTFTDLYDFASKVDLRTVNKRVLESMVMAGAFDSLEGYRSQQFAALDQAVEYGQALQEDRSSGQTSLFEAGDSEGAALETTRPPLPETPPWPYLELLAKEKEILSLYVSGHPLEKHRDEVAGLASLHLSKEELDATREDSNVVIAGIIASSKMIITKKDGRPMCFTTLEDFHGSIEVVTFPDLFEKSGEYFANDSMIILSGKLEKKEDRPKIIAEKVMPLNQARDKLARSVHVHFRTNGLEEDQLRQVKSICRKHAGNCKLVLHVQNHDGHEYCVLAKSVKTAPSPEVLQEIRAILGEEAVRIGRNLRT